MRASFSTLALASLLLAAGPGCMTQERIKNTGQEVRYVDWEEPSSKDETESDLLALTRKHPDSPKAWWQLGEFYERAQRYPDALRAYLRLQTEIEQIEEREGMQYTGGLFLLARTYVRMREWPDAVAVLGELMKRQPKSFDEAVLNKHFAEGHLMLGAIYYTHRRWGLAEHHLMTYKELTGYASNRADGMLIEIGDVLRPERAHVSPVRAGARAAPSPSPAAGGDEAIQPPAGWPSASAE